METNCPPDAPTISPKHKRAQKLIDSQLATALEKMKAFTTQLQNAALEGKATIFLDWSAMEMFANSGRITILTEAQRGLSRGLTVEGLRVHLLAQGLTKTIHGSSAAHGMTASAIRDAAVALYEELAFHV